MKAKVEFIVSSPETVDSNSNFFFGPPHRKCPAIKVIRTPISGRWTVGVSGEGVMALSRGRPIETLLRRWCRELSVEKRARVVIALAHPPMVAYLLVL
ncbi:hypothetical protein C1H46_026882 [Malus baccata]|uniref:Uncharacterized protein n=1 Tax=Malus baccata TaxID=106549 RepID=A0A540LM89_MALBA|nr:hypothetical protein C1H46_026882 [Malus baccata]